MAATQAAQATSPHVTRRAPQPEPTEEQLALMYRHLARPGWPTTLEAALAHRVYGPCLRQAARTTNLNRGAWRPAAVAPVALGLCHAHVPPIPTVQRQVPKAVVRGGSVMHTTPIAYWGHSRTTTPQWLGADRKRLAANDKDD